MDREICRASREVSDSSAIGELRWFLIFTKPAGEHAARVNLERQGYRVYHPRLLRSVLFRGRPADRIVSLFSRYLFVQADVLRQSLGPVRSTIGVVSIVRFGQDPVVVPNAVVHGLMQRADPKSGLHRLRHSARLESGSRVTVVDGLFKGLDGVFEREAGSERVVILLSLLNQESRVRIPSQSVVARLAT